MEGIISRAAMRRRIRERPDDIKQLEDRTWPAVGHDQRQRVFMTGADMDEMDVQSIDGGEKLRKCIQPALRLPPVIGRLPVAHQLLQPVGLNALRTIHDGFAVGPAGLGKTPPEICKRRLGDLNLERSDLLGRDNDISGVGRARKENGGYAGRGKA